MKTIAAPLLALLLVAPVQAEIFRPGGGRGAPPPAGPSGDHRPSVPHRGEGRGHGDRFSVNLGYSWFGPGYYARVPGYAYGYYPGYGPDYPYYYGVGAYGEPSAASTGILLGALAGGIIGNNSGAFGHSGARGAAWGAGAGLVLGSVVDAQRAREVRYHGVGRHHAVEHLYQRGGVQKIMALVHHVDDFRVCQRLLLPETLDLTPAQAAAKKAEYVARYKRPGTAGGWHFLTGDEPEIKRVTAAAGYRYTWDEQTRQFAHPTGIIVTTPDGRNARYLFGIEYGPRDLKFALVEASQGRVGSVVDNLLLYCYHYDPMTGRYGVYIMRALRIAGVATVLLIGTFIVVMVRREQSQQPAH